MSIEKLFITHFVKTQLMQYSFLLDDSILTQFNFDPVVNLFSFDPKTIATFVSSTLYCFKI